MKDKNHAVIKVDKDGQVFHQSGASMGSFSAARAQSHKNITNDAKKHSIHGRIFNGGGFVIGKTQPGGSPKNSSKSFQTHLLTAKSHVASSKASPADLKAAAKNPTGGLGYNKTVTVLKGGRRKRGRTQKRKIRKNRKSAKRFRRGGQPGGCFSGGKKSKRRKSLKNKSRKHKN